jgi:hypothetical protein
MKIPLIIDKNGFIVVSIAIVSIRGKGIYKPITMMIDTGSPETFLSEKDFLKLRIPHESLEYDKPAYGLGGGVFALYKMRNVTLSFKTDENNIEKINFPTFHVSLCEKRDERTRMIAERIPSILGTDFLKENKFVFYLDMFNNITYLEKTE